MKNFLYGSGAEGIHWQNLWSIHATGFRLQDRCEYNILIQAISIICQEGHFWNCIWSWNQSAQNAEFSISNKHFLSSFQSMHWYLTWTTNLLLIGNNFVKFWILKQFFANFKQISSLLSESLFLSNSSNNAFV